MLLKPRSSPPHLQLQISFIFCLLYPAKLKFFKLRNKIFKGGNYLLLVSNKVKLEKPGCHIMFAILVMKVTSSEKSLSLLLRKDSYLEMEQLSAKKTFPTSLKFLFNSNPFLPLFRELLKYLSRLCKRLQLLVSFCCFLCHCIWSKWLGPNSY